MLGCFYKGELHYITKIEDLREVMEEEVYETVSKFIEDEIHKQVEDRTCEIDYEHDSLEDEIDDLKDEIDGLREDLKETGNKYHDLKMEIKELYNQFINKEISVQVFIDRLEKLEKLI